MGVQHTAFRGSAVSDRLGGDRGNKEVVMKSCDCDDWKRDFGGVRPANSWEYCPFCGDGLEEDEAVDEAVFCEVCGALLKNDSKCSWCGHEREVYGKDPLATATEQLSLLELSKRMNNSPISDIADALSKKSDMIKEIHENPVWSEFPSAMESVRDDMIDSMRIPPGLLNRDDNGAASWEVTWNDVYDVVLKNWDRLI